jgi:hypothetical protein
MDTLYLFHRTVRIEDARLYARTFFDHGAGRTRCVEVWAPQDRSRNDGSAFLEYRAFDDDGLLIATRRIEAAWH